MAGSKTELDQIEHATDVRDDQDDDDSISVRSEARGDHLPDGYFSSLRFIALVIVSTEPFLER